MPHPSIDDIHTLLREGEIELALERIFPLAREQAPRHLNEALLQAARVNALRKKKRVGTVSDSDYTAQRNELTHGLLEFLDDLARDLGRTPNPVSSGPPVAIAVPIIDPGTREKIIGATTQLKSLAWLRRGLDASRAVCRILTAAGDRGSGFMVAGGRVVTNHHVLPSRAVAEGAEVEFNYEEDLDGRTLPVACYRVAPGSWRSSEAFDCAVISLLSDSAAVALDAWGTLTLSPDAVPVVGDHVVIVQHPEGGLKQIAVTDNRVINLFDHRLHYTTDTLPGSSGAPVFDDRWRVVAVHHAGGHLAKNARGERIYANEGILARYVVEALSL